MHAFQVALRPSKQLCMATLLLHLCMLSVLLFYFDGMLCWLGLAVLAGSFIYAQSRQHLRHAAAIHRISVDRQGAAAVFMGNGQTAFAAVLLSGSLVTRWAVFLKWDIGGRIGWQMILPDMTDTESYRRLRVWARWGRQEAEAEDNADA